jgi:hypothetical protein
VKNVGFVSLDVHAETIAVAVAESGGEVRNLGIIPNRVSFPCSEPLLWLSAKVMLPKAFGPSRTSPSARTANRPKGTGKQVHCR